MEDTPKEETPKYQKKGHTGPKAPPVILPGEVETEQVPIDIKQLADAKAVLMEAEQAAQAAAGAGISLVKTIGYVAQMSVKAEEAEKKTRESLRQILATHNIRVDEFMGFDFDKGVVNIRKKA